MAWPKERRLIGKKHSRIDGPAKSTGTAKYSYDINRPGMLHGVMFTSPHAHAKLTALDTADAEKMPGVKAIHVIVKPGSEVYYAGDPILALAADTEEHAYDAVRAIASKAQFELLDFLVKEEDALKVPDKTTVPPKGPNVRVAGEGKSGDPAAAFQSADAVVEGEYGVPVISHQCLESHGSVAEWDKDGNLTVWASTQATSQLADGFRRMLNLQPGQVRCITNYMGGGFGSKFVADVWDVAAVQLAKKAGAAVKMMLDRATEITVAGNRPSAYGKVKIAGTKEGKITAYEVDCYGTPGVGGGQTVNLGMLPYPYEMAKSPTMPGAIPNVQRKHTVVRLNIGNNRAMRAPGHPQNCALTEGAVDDLAAKLGIDPMQLRLKNLPENDPTAKVPTSIRALQRTIYEEEIQIAAKLSEWDKKWHKPGEGNGPIKHGIGMAMHTWGGGPAGGNQVAISISADGSVLIQAGTQDLGTGQRTVLPIVAAEALGLDVKDITVRIGESVYGPGSGSGGSTTCPGTSPLAWNAAVAARDDLFDKLAAKLGAKKEDLAVSEGKVVDKANNKSWPWKEACARLGMDISKGEAKSPVPQDMANNGVGGVQIAEVKVDTETGVVRCTKMVAVQDCGLIINKLCAESQVAGGVIMGVNYALFEEIIMDRHTGRQVNPDMEFYKLGGMKDMPHIIVHMHDTPQMAARGVIGIGEPPTISTCAAVGNAVFNAIGVRVPFAPYTPERVLAALATKGGKG
jgi:xanthine dehydrogenase YagR molybdenum-binding subunit